MRLSLAARPRSSPGGAEGPPCRRESATVVGMRNAPRDLPPSGAARWRWPLTRRPHRLGRWVAALGLTVLVGLAVATPRDACPPAAEPGAGAEPAPVRSAVRVHPRSPEEHAAVLEQSLDVWSEHPETDASLDVVVDSSGRQWLHARGLAFEVIVPDVEAAAAAERSRLAELAAAKPPTPAEWFTEYRDLEELAALRPDLATTETIGASLEGRPLRAIRIRGKGPRELGMLIDSGMHAREWISMMVGTCIADRLLRGYDHDPRLRRFVDGTELVVIPVANPDGYVHSWQRDRYWRKNRRDGHGVDLNRNFGVAWGGAGSSGSTASQVYRGAAPFSEPESEAIRRLIEAEAGGFSAHVDLHSYGQLVLHPWSHTRERSRDHRRLSSIAGQLVEALAGPHGERYRPMSGESLYPASGTLMDWAHGTHGVASFVIELRPRGGTGFVLPPDQIVPTCDEALAAVLTLGELGPGGP
jgi:carboxypeptidase A4